MKHLLKYAILFLLSVLSIFPTNAQETMSNWIFGDILSYFMEGRENVKWYSEYVNKTIKDDNITEDRFTDVFEVEDILNNKRIYNECEINRVFGVYGIYFSPLSHSPRHTLIVCNNHATLYKADSKHLLQHLIEIYESGNNKITERDIIIVLKHAVFPYGRKDLCRDMPNEEKIRNLDYVTD